MQADSEQDADKGGSSHDMPPFYDFLQSMYIVSAIHVNGSQETSQ